jgi:sulfite exporter TauE/SafE
MQISEFGIISGLLLGFASALHCAAMCGGIASGVAFMFSLGTPAARAKVLLTAQGGRITAYVIAGAVLGAIGTGAYGAFDRSSGHELFRWGAAAALMWVGLSVAGLLPQPVLLHRIGGGFAAGVSRYASRYRSSALVGPFAAGLAWGAVPCPMVYAALFTAVLSGSLLTGAVVMLGFGLGTLPATLATAYGVTFLARIEARALTRTLLGLAIALFGIAAAYPQAPGAALLCLSPG